MKPLKLGEPCTSRRFIEMGGDVHLVSPVGGGSHTLCGVAHDAVDSERDEALRWHPTGLMVVGCRTCINVISACRGVLIRQVARTKD